MLIFVVSVAFDTMRAVVVSSECAVAFDTTRAVVVASYECEVRFPLQSSRSYVNDSLRASPTSLQPLDPIIFMNL